MNNNENTNTTVTLEAPASNGPRPEPTHLTIEPRKWKVDYSGNKPAAQRTFITDMAGGLTEAICLGNWKFEWMNIYSPQTALRKNTDYVFAFWLNGGETEIEQETCEFRIYLNDSENPMIFRLNRDYIKTEKYNKGWYRFMIPFNSGESENEAVVAHFEFVAMRAYCAVLPDKPEYAGLPDEERPDPRIPQRHNIAHGASGYPRDKSWSYLVFGKEAMDLATVWGPSGRNASGNGNNTNTNTNTKTRSGTFEQFMNAGVDIEGMLEHMDSENLLELLREPGAIERLSNLGVDIDGLLEHLDDEDKIELLRDMM
jgi:hypothetical protein